MRGKLNGGVWLSGPQNPIIVRQWVNPVNPGTDAQTEIRSSLKKASASWESLNDAKRNAWIDYAVSIAWPGSPRSLYIRIESFAEFGFSRGICTAPATDAPLSFEQPVLSIANFAPTGTPGQVAFGFKLTNASAVACNSAVWYSVQYARSRYFHKGPYQTESLNKIAVAGSTTVNTSVVVAGGVAGNVVFIRVRPYLQVVTGTHYDLIGSPLRHRAVLETIA